MTFKVDKDSFQLGTEVLSPKPSPDMAGFFKVIAQGLRQSLYISQKPAA